MLLAQVGDTRPVLTGQDFPEWLIKALGVPAPKGWALQAFTLRLEARGVYLHTTVVRDLEVEELRYKSDRSRSWELLQFLGLEGQGVASATLYAASGKIVTMTVVYETRMAKEPETKPMPLLWTNIGDNWERLNAES